ncbi:diaminobutyrate acetyltransferase [Glycomyces algeriensis]|uniref:L-2,4-diaminobutyric acid acetyltransferase n=1 Tax=Glycomyces algeriensis TaxID=256037 RepID=A0A9W6GDX4_9ACTN|nr:diaminobutyrate acetyltransferase [Glycomyces algeriensis]MDA1366630.1 diaminobutyrate acetyltransferase [Glycomyces algeriensis]MDR7352287.1 L-2,4-diaminobutyric acid acetyltransferase [Glycomyces algeriensis]GLI45022.1 L-2,4-diaminobutyric acid acetyltransferase [Glycomyces algeriensis]
MPSGDASDRGPQGPATQVKEAIDPSGDLSFGSPTPAEGTDLWNLAREAGNLDVNSRYAYLLWCRDFAATSVVARDLRGAVAGFITGYRRPEAPDVYFVWQVAVAPGFRRRGLARTMLDHAVLRMRSNGVRYVETTVTPENKASMRLFESFAEANGADLTRDVLFSERELGSGHESEVLHRIGPFTGPARTLDGPLPD